MTALSPCAIVILSVIAQRDQVTVNQLRTLVPWTEPSFRCEDVSAWFDCVQELLDEELIRRKPADDGYVYAASCSGLLIVCALSGTLLGRLGGQRLAA